MRTSNILKNEKSFEYLYKIVVVDNNKNENYKKIKTNLNNFYKKLFNFKKNTSLKNNNIFSNNENTFARDYN